METFLAIARKAYRFPNPDVSLSMLAGQIGQDGKAAASKQTTTDFKVAFAEIHPGTHPGAFGEPVRLPLWVKDDNMFKWALKDGDLLELAEAPVIPVTADAPSAEASRQATLALADAQRKQVELLAGLTQHHADFIVYSVPVEVLNVSGYSKSMTVDDARQFVGAMTPDEQQGFLADAAAWEPEPEPVVKGKGKK